MLGSEGIQPVTLVFSNAKNSFLHLSVNFARRLGIHENQVLELSWGVSPPVFLSWTASYGPDESVEISRHFAQKLGLKDGEQGFLRPCHNLQSVHQVFVEPLTPDDWEILELHSAVLEQKLLDQIRVVFSNGVFPVWVDQHTVIYIKTASLSPSVSYGRLEQFTELHVSPKPHPGTEHLRHARSLESGHYHQPQNPDASSTSASNIDPDGLREGAWGGIANLNNLMRCMFTRSSVKEEVHIPTIPTLFKDCILRSCGSPPRSLSHLNTSHGDVHVLPWIIRSKENWNPGHSVLSYVKLSKILCPKVRREKVKLEREKKEKTDEKDGGGDKKSGAVVRIVCHDLEKLQEDLKYHRAEEIYSGKVWIPTTLQRRLGMESHSAVLMQPLHSPVRIAEAVMLQPLLPLAKSEKEDYIQTVFLDWVHAQSHEPLTCLTGRSHYILLPVSEGKEEFVLTIVKPEKQQEDEMFFLSNSVLKKNNVQIVRKPHQTEHKADHEDPCLDFPSFSFLGGVEEISLSGFEHIFHSLMAGPLSRVLVFMGRGLRSGALLITGAKGSGKSSLSRALCRKARELLDAHVEVVSCKMLKGKRVDTIRQILEEAFEQAVWRHPSVVLLDDLDHICGSSSEQEQGGEEVQWLHVAHSLLDIVDDVLERGSLVALVVTAQDVHSLHQNLTAVQGSNFFQTFCNIKSPSLEQRVEILRCLMHKASIQPCPPALDLNLVAKDTDGFTPQDLSLLLERATHANNVHGSEDLSNADFAVALRDYTPPSRWDAKLQTPTGPGMEQIGGLHEARQTLMDAILLPAKHPLLFANLPIRHCTGVLLYGAPGTGKTILAGAVARESGMNFICVKGPELLSKYIGASEQAVRDVFERAQSARPCVLFFDEFDSMAPRRGQDSTGVTDRVVNQLLTQLDGVEGLTGVYVLAATSRPDLIDPALLRPGRLDKSVYCAPPDREARLEILKAMTSSLPLAADVDLEQMAVETELFTGADLKAVLYNALLEAVHHSRSAPHDFAAGSDSDASLSSMTFLNPSSGSDGEGDAGMEQSMVMLDHSDLPPEDAHHNIWRLYFDSSFESEMDHNSVSELVRRNSQSMSGRNSTAEMQASSKDQSSCPSPIVVLNVKEGFQELSQEQLEELRAEVDTVKNHYHRSADEPSSAQTASTRTPSVLIGQDHLTAALANTRASVSREDWRRYHELYESFGSSKKSKSSSAETFKAGQRATLA